MNLSRFISSRIIQPENGGFSSVVHKIAVASIAIGLAASIVSFLIMEGFRNTVVQKIYGFSGHLLINKLTLNNSVEEPPFDVTNNLKQVLGSNPNIKHYQAYAHQAGLIKADDDILGVLMKGVSREFDTTAFNNNLVEGRFLHFPDSGYSREVVISKIISDKLNLKKDDEVIVHFFQNPPRFRRLRICGIYETNLSDYFDSKVILADLRLIARLNDWPDSIAGGIEIFVNDVNRIDETGYELAEAIDYDLNVTAVRDKYIQVFEWLQLLSRQVNILLGIILFIVCVNMISIVIILVMERTPMIGVLKALGATDQLVRKIFLYNGARLLWRGMLLGNAIGLGFCLLQDKMKIIRLNPQDYYMNYVPVGWSWQTIVLLNVLTFVIVLTVLLIPTALIMRISPVKAIRFD
ncbi:MAG: ABC transporter permease [Cyclobacteriaceae bacterium]|nr:ABC transporter permease [Cyclobacteriaceae bacterium]